MPGEFCRKPCHGGNNTLQQAFRISAPAAPGGGACEAADGDLRNASCTSTVPCPVDCQGAWQTTVPCNASCRGRAGTSTESFSITVQAQYNGTACEATNGTERTVNCTNSNPCPVDCQGTWELAAACNASCGNGTGFSTEHFHVTAEAQYNGTACEAADGTLRFPSCINSPPCLIDCSGGWRQMAACNASCGNGTGFSTAYWNVDVEAQHNGMPCEAAQGTLRFINCINRNPCPVDCRGDWQVAAACNASCGNGTGFSTDHFVSLLRHNMVELHVDTHMANRGSWAASTVTTVLSTAEVPGSQQQPAMLHAEAAAALALNA